MIAELHFPLLSPAWQIGLASVIALAAFYGMVTAGFQLIDWAYRDRTRLTLDECRMSQERALASINPDHEIDWRLEMAVRAYQDFAAADAIDARESGRSCSAEVRPPPPAAIPVVYRAPVNRPPVTDPVELAASLAARARAIGIRPPPPLPWKPGDPLGPPP